MPSGQIVRALSGFYYVTLESGEVVECKARGVFKFEKKKTKPLVGDYVEIEIDQAGKGWIYQVKKRTTELIRPAIANVDQAIIVCALREPDFQQMPLDRLLVHAERENLRIVICLTKSDLVEDDTEIREIRHTYEQAGYVVLETSSKRPSGIDLVAKELQGRISVFAGQSGVGKSTLLNQIMPDQDLETGEVSRKIGRGKHTTRTVELIPLPDGGQVADTPGFSQLSFDGMEPEELSDLFADFRPYQHDCRFRGCLHRKEPGCAVKEAVKDSKITQTRYHHYLLFLEEIEQWQQRRY
ncbi:ribosome small subunit-dependent GTPase A [Risungbinella massiliensis]|uniref:ribosome small subunit-dependent GTPase A n=1 Tax=Risungbinella massiliensis TaxID=1329796 RepID=UPI0005CC53B3|nr:ribosome small subunit-dependent GTPase A [Risungbinella massiliensis]